MLWVVALTAIAHCNHTECRDIGNWLEYTVFRVPDADAVRLCIANHADHTLEMSLTTTCPEGDVYTCFDCTEPESFRGCGPNKCGGGASVHQ